MFRPLREVSWSPDSSTIAFARQRDSRDRTQASDIYMVDADGTNLRKLDVGGLSVIAPAYSPDGTTIAFTSHYWRSSGGDNLDLEETDVYTVGIDGSGLRRLTTDGDATGPDWTGDGRIRFYRQPFPLGSVDENVPSLWLINADGSGETARPAPVIRPGITRRHPVRPAAGLLVQPDGDPAWRRGGSDGTPSPPGVHASLARTTDATGGGTMPRAPRRPTAARTDTPEELRGSAADPARLAASGRPSQARDPPRRGDRAQEVPRGRPGAVVAPRLRGAGRRPRPAADDPDADRGDGGGRARRADRARADPAGRPRAWSTRCSS